MNDKQLVDAAVLASILGTTTNHVNKLQRDHVLPAYRVGKRQLRFDVAECLGVLRIEPPTAPVQEAS
ncbi:MAG: hypothetical protein IPK26_00895 [Planctomycetes bacterium]|nr:hypothetical protein [Planctomycetota bacterium]